MSDQDTDAEEENGDEDEDTQYGGSTQDVDAVEQTERREDAVETESEDDESTDEENG